MGSCPSGVGHGAAEPPTAPAIGMEARRAETRYEVRQPGPEEWPNDQRRKAVATPGNSGNRRADGMATLAWKCMASSNGILNKGKHTSGGGRPQSSQGAAGHHVGPGSRTGECRRGPVQGAREGQGSE